MNEIDIYLHTMQSMCPMIKNEDLANFKESLSIKTFQKGEIIFPIYEQHDSIIFVTKGLVRAFYINSKGEEKNAWFVKEYEFVSDYPSFLSNSKSNYTFQCIENTVGVVLPKKSIFKAYSEHSSIEKYGRLIAEEVVKMMQFRIEELLFYSAKERYKMVLENESDLVARISLNHLSSYIGIERQSLTRIRKEIFSEK